MIFGVQQLIEGGLWLALSTQAAASHVLTIAYLLFSNVLWPIYVPLAVWMIEPRRGRRRTISLAVGAGAAISLFFMAAMIMHPVWAEIRGAHIKYHLPHPHHTIAFAIYFIATCLAPLLSSHRMIRLFGVALICSSIVARIIFTTWFASVWCFFAAVISAIVLLHFLNRSRPKSSQAVFARR